MNFTGYNYRNLFDLNSNYFLFKDLVVNEHNYKTKFILSGENKIFNFSFSGGKVFDDSGKYVWSYNSGEPFDLELKLNNGVFVYYVNSNLIGNGYATGGNFALQKLIIDTSGAGVSFNPIFKINEEMSSKLQLTVDPIFEIGKNVNFLLKNNSNAKFKIYSSSMKPMGKNFVNIEQNQTGVIEAGEIKSFSSLSSENFPDADYQFSSRLDLSVVLNSNIGELILPSVQSTAEYIDYKAGVEYKFPESFSNKINHKFFGQTGLNKFTFIKTEIEKDFQTSITRTRDNEQKKVTSYLEFNLTGFPASHTGYFITGINMTNSGLYSEPPSVVFSDFSGLYGEIGVSKNLISYSTGDSFDLLFVGSGTGVSAKAYTEVVHAEFFTGLNNGNVQPPYKFRTITGVTLNSGGSGITGDYSLQLPNGIIDYLSEYTDSPCYSNTNTPCAEEYGYVPLSFTTNIKATHGFASGKALLNESGRVSGVVILGAGFNYDKDLRFPKISFIRSKEDAHVELKQNRASGTCILNSSGENISFLNNCEISGSMDNFNSSLNTGYFSGKYYFGPIIFSKENPNLYIKLKSKNSSFYGEDTAISFSLYETGMEKINFSIPISNTYEPVKDFFF